MKKNKCMIILLFVVLFLFQACATTDSDKILIEMDKTEKTIKETEQAKDADNQGQQNVKDNVQKKKEKVDDQQNMVQTKTQEIISSTEALHQLIDQEKTKGEKDAKQGYQETLNIYGSIGTDENDSSNGDGLDSSMEDEETITQDESTATKDELVSNTNIVSNAQTVSMIESEPNESHSQLSVDDHIRTLVSQWAVSWSKKNYTAYINFYKNDYKPKPWISHDSWLVLRKKRLEKEYIQVNISNIEIEIIDESQANAFFDQYYESNTYTDATRKQLVFSKINNDSWKIVKEDTLNKIQ